MQEIRFSDFRGEGPAYSVRAAAYWPDEHTWLRLTWPRGPAQNVSPEGAFQGKWEYEPKTGEFLYTASPEDRGRIIFRAGFGVDTGILVLERALRDPVQGQLLMQPYPRSLPDPQEYAWAERRGRALEWMNNRFQFTSRIVCSGYRLELDGSGSGSVDARLFNREDIRELTLVADTILVKGRVRLPETRLNIFARELVFEGEGCFNTSAKPEPLRAPETEEGFAGGGGGHISVAAQVLRQSKEAVRFLMNGGKGQDGGPGTPADPGAQMETFPVDSKRVRVANGWIKFVDWDFQQLRRDRPAQAEQLSRAIYVEYWEARHFKGSPERRFTEFDEYKDKPQYWYSNDWPDGQRHVFDQYPWPTKLVRVPLRAPAGKDGDGGKGGILRLRARLAGDEPVAGLFQSLPGQPGANGAASNALTQLPSPKKPTRVKLIFHRNVWEMNNWDEVRLIDERDLSAHIQVPEPGAAKAGQPGRVGITHRRWLHPLLLSRVVEYARQLFRAGDFDQARRILEDYQAAIDVGVSDSPSVADTDEALHGAVLHLLRQASFAEAEGKPNQARGYRNQANLIIRQYGLEEHFEEPPDLRVFRDQIASLLAQLRTGLDAFGMPAGWVPTLSYQVSFDLYKKAIEDNVPAICFARWVVQHYGALSNATSAMRVTIENLMRQRSELAAIYNEAQSSLGPQRKALLEVLEQKTSLEMELKKEEANLREQAEKIVGTRAVAAGVVRMVGAVLQLIPFGQPALGAAGQGLDVLASIDPDKSLEDTFTKKLPEVLEKASKDVLGDQAQSLKSAAERRNKEEEDLEKSRRTGDENLNKQWRALEDRQAKRIEEEENEAAAFEEKQEKIDAILNDTKKTDDEKRKLFGTLNREEAKARAARRRAQDTEERKQRRTEEDEALKEEYAEKDKQREATAKQRQKEAEGFGTQIKRVADNVKTATDQFSRGILSLRAPQSAIDAKLAQLRTYSADFQRLAAKVADITQRVGEFVTAFQTTLASMQATLASLSAVNTAIDELNRARDGALAALDPSLLSHFRTMESEAVESLVRYQYYMVKAYEYRLVRPCAKADYRLSDVYKKVEALVKAVEIARLDDQGGQLPADKIEAMKEVYRAHLRAIVDEIVHEVNTRAPASEGDLTFILRPEQLNELNRSGSVTLNLMEEGILSPLNENIRFYSIGVDPNDGIGLDSGGEELTLQLWFAHSGFSLVRRDGRIYAFRTLVNPIELPESWHGRSWNTSCEITKSGVTVRNNPVAREETDLLDTLLRGASGASNGSRVRYSSPAAWADITIVRDATPVERAAKLQIKRLKLRFGCSYAKANARYSSLELLGSDGLRPYFALDKADINGNSDGRGFALRVYEKGSTVTVLVPMAVGGRRFREWQLYDYQSNNPTSSTEPRQVLQLGGSVRAVAAYAAAAQQSLAAR